MNRPRLIRGLRIAWSVWWGVLCLLLIGLWVSSYWWFTFSSMPLPIANSCDIATMKGDIGARIYVDPDNTGEFSILHLRIGQWPERELQAVFNRIPGAYGFGARSNKFESVLALPNWLLVLLTAILATVPWLPRLPWKFSLRTLLIATTLIAVVLGLIVWSSS